MKTVNAIVLAFAFLASASAFVPLATRAVGPKKAPAKAPPKKVAKKAPKKVFSKPSAPSAGGYPSFKDAAESWKPFNKISGGGNKAPPTYWVVPDLSDPAMQKPRDPAFFAAAAKTRKALGTNAEFAYDDGLTVLERKQRKLTPAFLTGSAKSQADVSTIRSDLDGESFAFGLDGDRFQLLFISIFALFTLVGCLSGALVL